MSKITKGLWKQAKKEKKAVKEARKEDKKVDTCQDDFPVSAIFADKAASARASRDRRERKMAEFENSKAV